MSADGAAAAGAGARPLPGGAAPQHRASGAAVTSPAFEFFLELGAYSFDHHPPDVWINASTIVRTGIVGPAPRATPRTLRTRLGQAGGPAWMYVRDTLRRRRPDPVAGAEPVSVLCPLPFRRPDYLGFVRPVFRRLAEGGTSSGVLTTGAGVDLWLDRAVDDRTVVHALEASVSLPVYHETRRLLAKLRPAVRDLGARFRLDAAQRHEVSSYFARYAFDKALAARVIERLAPKVALGIHFVARRGWQAALREADANGSKPTIMLMQHGAFSADEEFHDFEGADLVLLWGDRWRRELLHFPTAPFGAVPPAVVAGNPKYDASILDAAASASAQLGAERGERRVRVLYVSNHGGNHRTLTEPLGWALDASATLRGFDLAIRPHPAESAATLRSLVGQAGLPDHAVVNTRHPVQDDILAADVVVGPPSTSLFEAARLGRPVVLLTEAPNRVFDGFLAASSGPQLHAFVHRWQADGAWRRSVLDRQSSILEDLFGARLDAHEAVAALVRRYL